MARDMQLFKKLDPAVQRAVGTKMLIRMYKEGSISKADLKDLAYDDEEYAEVLQAQ